MRIPGIWYGSGCGPGSSDPYLWLTDPDADPGAQKHTDPTDPDPCPDAGPEHWEIYVILQRKKSPKEVTQQQKVFLTLFAWWWKDVQYVQYVRPHLEFSVQSWSPWTKADKECLEKVQRRAEGMMSGLAARKALQRTGTHNVRRAKAPAGHAAGSQDPGWKWQSEKWNMV